MTNVPVAVLGGKSVQENIARCWAKDIGVAFSSYVLRHIENRGDIVKGTLFEIDMDDAKALVEWILLILTLKEVLHGVFGITLLN